MGGWETCPLTSRVFGHGFPSPSEYLLPFKQSVGLVCPVLKLAVQPSLAQFSPQLWAVPCLLSLGAQSNFLGYEDPLKCRTGKESLLPAHPQAWASGACWSHTSLTLATPLPPRLRVTPEQGPAAGS